jgi:inosine-uridine nucleoside N-ribohydrolase
MKLILDTDLNFPSDDFQALLLLLQDQRLELQGCGAAAGNTWAEEVEVNTRRALDLAGSPHVPVFPGPGFESFTHQSAWAQDLKTRRIRSFIGAHEKSDKPRVRISRNRPKTNRHRDAAGFLVEMSRRYPEELVLLCTAPLTNLTKALQLEPDLPGFLRRTHIMGGNFEETGSKAQDIDFNFWFDPPAAQTVLNSGLSIVLLPLDICRAAAVDPGFIREVRAFDRGLASVFVDDFLGMVKQHGPHMPLWDQLLALVTRRPDLITDIAEGYVQVDRSLTVNRGRSRFRPSPGGPVRLIRGIDRHRVRETLLTFLAGMAVMPCLRQPGGLIS